MKDPLNFKQLLTLTAAFLFSSNLYALDYKTRGAIAFENEFRFFMEGALHKGGDSTENIPLYNGHEDVFYDGVKLRAVDPYTGSAAGETLEEEIQAGGFMRASFGAEFPVAKDFAISTSIGYLFDEISGDLTYADGKGYASYSRTVIDLIGFYIHGRHRFGLGAAIHYNPKFDWKEVDDDYEMHGVYRFSDAFGATLQYDYLLSKDISIGLRYTNISYDFEDVVIGDTDATSVTSFKAECASNCNDLLDASSLSGHVTYRF